MTNETVDDLLREMREGPVHACFVTEVGAAADANGKFRDFADRLDAAYKRDMRTAMDEVTRLHASLSDSAKTLDEYREENARLKAALKPVLGCTIEKFKPGSDTYAVAPFYTSATVGVEDAEGDAIQDESIAIALNAVREAQRIMALVEESYRWDVVAEMLRQAADMLEREEKRERKYEYAVKWNDGLITKISQTFPCRDELDAIRKYNLTIVRREVGEWEEVEG